MSMKNKKGFTLIELLAVIVILAIVVVLAVIKVRDFLDKSNSDAVVANASVFIKAINEGASTSRITGTFQDGEYTVSEIFAEGISINGTKPDNGYISIVDGVVTTGCLKYGEDYAEIKNGKATYSEYCEIGSQSYEYAYTGEEQTFTARRSGTYKLELWGAQGGNYSTDYVGGYGAYTVAYINLQKDDVLYVNVGQAGSTYAVRTQNNGTYNGGGGCTYDDGNWTGGSGGGATAISTISAGTSTLDNYTYKYSSDYYKSRILVAAGGGGAVGTIVYRSGGHGAGYLSDYGTGSNSVTAYGASQTAAGYNSGSTTETLGGLGFGGRGYYGAGGGAGYYGGAGGYGSAGTGGSSYTGSSRIINGVTYCYNCSASSMLSQKTVSVTCAEEDPTEKCAKLGDGYAKISKVDSVTDKFKQKFPDYQRVNYVQSNGTQRIVTNIIPTNTTGMMLEVQSQNTSSDLVLAGSKGSGNRFWIGNLNGKVYLGWAGTYYQPSESIDANIVSNFKLNYMNNRKLISNNNTFRSDIVDLGSQGQPIYIFCGNNGGSPSYYSSIKLYSLEITEESDIIATYVPCYRKSDTKPGLCDLVSGEFLTTPDGVANLVKGTDIN